MEVPAEILMAVEVPAEVAVLVVAVAVPSATIRKTRWVLAVAVVVEAALLHQLTPAMPVTRQTLRPLTRSQLLPVRPTPSPLVLRVDKLLYRGTHSNV